MNSTALASLAGVRPVAVLPARGIRAPGVRQDPPRRRDDLDAPNRGVRPLHAPEARRAVAPPRGVRRGQRRRGRRRRRARDQARPQANLGSMLEEASQLEAGIDASENDEVISESTRFKRAPQSSPAFHRQDGRLRGAGDGGESGGRNPPVAVAAAAAAHDQRAPRRRHRDRRSRRGGRRVRRGRRRGLRARPRRRGAAAGFALLKAGQFIGPLKEKAVPSLGQREGKAKAKEGREQGRRRPVRRPEAGGGGDEDRREEGAAKAAAAAGMPAILAASSFAGSSDLNKERLRRALGRSRPQKSGATAAIGRGTWDTRREREKRFARSSSARSRSAPERSRVDIPDEAYGKARKEAGAARRERAAMGPWLGVIVWDCIATRCRCRSSSCVVTGVLVGRKSAAAVRVTERTGSVGRASFIR